MAGELLGSWDGTVRDAFVGAFVVASRATLVGCKRRGRRASNPSLDIQVRGFSRTSSRGTIFVVRCFYGWSPRRSLRDGVFVKQKPRPVPVAVVTYSLADSWARQRMSSLPMRYTLADCIFDTRTVLVSMFTGN